jgi:hypothetical protein
MQETSRKEGRVCLVLLAVMILMALRDCALLGWR